MKIIFSGILRKKNLKVESIFDKIKRIYFISKVIYVIEGYDEPDMKTLLVVSDERK
jgi:hypothetical protein